MPTNSRALITLPGSMPKVAVSLDGVSKTIYTDLLSPLKSSDLLSINYASLYHSDLLLDADKLKLMNTIRANRPSAFFRAALNQWIEQSSQPSRQVKWSKFQEDDARQRRQRRTLNISWLFAAIGAGQQRSSTNQIKLVIEGLNSFLLERRFDELSTVLGVVPTKSLSPELMITLIRVTFSVRDRIPAWFKLCRKIQDELQSRGLPSEKMLLGLI